jgi:hypothetical protein
LEAFIFLDFYGEEAGLFGCVLTSPERIIKAKKIMEDAYDKNNDRR